MDYCTVKEIAESWGVSSRMVSLYCKDNRIEGAFKMGNMWLVPRYAKRPCDLRINNGKRRSVEESDDE